jgi:hypothetical protein
MLASLALRRMMKHRDGRSESTSITMWRRIWQARLDRLDSYLHRLRQLRKAQSMGITRRRQSP